MRILEALADESDGHHAPGTQQPFTLTEEKVAPADIIRLLQASRLVARQLGLRPGQRAVLVNGRVCCPLAVVCVGPYPQLHETACWAL